MYRRKDQKIRGVNARAADRDAIRIRKLRSTIGASREQNSTFIGTDDGVIATDATGRVQFVSRKAERITGWRSEEVIGRPIEDVYPLLVENAAARIQDQAGAI